MYAGAAKSLAPGEVLRCRRTNDSNVRPSFFEGRSQSVNWSTDGMRSAAHTDAILAGSES